MGKNKTEIKNQITFNLYVDYLSLLAMNLFEWVNLPEGITSRIIEKMLFSNGECMFYKDSTLGLMVAKNMNHGINHHDEPIKLQPYSTNGSIEAKDYKNHSEAVLIRNNFLSIPSYKIVEYYSLEIADIKRTQQINVNAQKTPILILCSDRQKLTLKNVYEQYTGNSPVIFGDKEFNGVDMTKFSVLKSDAPIVFDKLEVYKHQVLNEFLTFLGINNANMDKKERLVENEVEANNELVQLFAETMLETRNEACMEINKLFGTNIQVKKKIQNKAVFEAHSEDSETDSETDSEEVA